MALLDGNLFLPVVEGFQYGDLIHYEDKYYLPYPPFPVILLLPFISAFGVDNVNSVLICMILTCINFFTLYSILNKIKVPRRFQLWLIAAFFFGTGYWWVLITSHHVYGFAHITCLTLILLALSELFGRKRGWIIGICLGAAFLSRQMSVFTGIFFLYVLISDELKGSSKNFINPLIFSLSSLFFLAIYFFYNYARFENIFDTGYDYITYIGILKNRVDEYGVFSLNYFMYNFYTMFIKGHNILFEGAGLLKIKGMDLFGTSLIGASPFLLLAFKTTWKKDYVIVIAISIVVILTGLLLYHNNGFHQVNANRFALDFMPLLFLLVAKSIENTTLWVLRFSVCYAVILNILSFSIHLLYGQ